MKRGVWGYTDLPTESDGAFEGQVSPCSPRSYGSRGPGVLGALLLLALWLWYPSGATAQDTTRLRSFQISFGGHQLQHALSPVGGLSIS